jgi:hypothetical protein
MYVLIHHVRQGEYIYMLVLADVGAGVDLALLVVSGLCLKRDIYILPGDTPPH